MLYEVLPSMTARENSFLNDRNEVQEENDLAWLPRTLKSKLTNAEISFLQQERRNSKEETRQQIARDLHNTTLQSLSTLSYQLTALQLSQDTIQPKDVQTLKEELKAATAQLRSNIDGLRSESSEGVSIHAALESHITQLQQSVVVPRVYRGVDSAAEGLPPQVQRCVKNILKEGLSNCINHAQANHVWLKVFFQKHHLAVKITDDGKGFAVAQRLRVAKRKNSGLIGLAGQVAGLNGRVFVRSQEGKGALLASFIPGEWSGQ